MYSFQVNKKSSVTNLMFQKIIRSILGVFLIVQTMAVWAEETVWSGEQLVTDTFYVNNGQTLRILPGTVVKLSYGVSILGYGTIIAEGTPETPILFTSSEDDASVFDDTALESKPSPWAGIQATQGSFKHVVIRYAGKGAWPGLLLKGAVTVDSSKVVHNDNAGVEIDTTENPIISNTLIAYNGSNGISQDSYGADPIVATLNNNIIKENAKDGVYIDKGSLVLNSNQLINNKGWAIRHQSGEINTSTPFTITSNLVKGNGKGIQIPVSLLPGLGEQNKFLDTGNQFFIGNSIWFSGQSVVNNVNLTSLHVGAEHAIGTYVFKHGLSVPSHLSLTIDAGVNLKFDKYRSSLISNEDTLSKLAVSGILTVNGTKVRPVVLTSVSDDLAGGDTNSNQQETVPESGDWSGIEFLVSSSVNRLNYIDVRYAGIVSNSPDVQLTHAKISNAPDYAISVDSAPLQISNSELFSNRNDALLLKGNAELNAAYLRIYGNGGSGLIFQDSASGTISDSEIFANTASGIISTSSESVDARGNWWGAENGPSGDEGGNGDAIYVQGTGSVESSSLFQGYKTEGSRYFYFNAGDNSSKGDLAAVTVTQGQDSAEWGSNAANRVLYDFSSVDLTLSGLPETGYFKLHVTYLNEDNGTNAQSLLVNQEIQLHNSLVIPSNKPVSKSFWIPAADLKGSQAELSFVRNEGIRATVAEILLVEEQSVFELASAKIELPLDQSYIPAKEYLIQGTVENNTSDAPTVIELGIKSNGQTHWYLVNAAGDGNWHYSWVPEQDGVYELRTRTDGIIAEAVVNVTVLTDVKAQLDNLVAYDTPADNGGSITIEWSLDDSLLVSYQLVIERRLVGSETYEVITIVDAGTGSFVDLSVENNIAYEYQTFLKDLAGNPSIVAFYGPAKAIDNQSSDTEIPEDVTSFVAQAAGTSIYLSWVNSVDSQRDIIDQLLDYSVDGGATWSNVIHLQKNIESYELTGLQNGSSYLTRLRVRDSAQPSNVSNGVLSNSVLIDVNSFLPLSGTISGNQSIGPGVYHITDDLTVPNGVTLSIRPGTIIKVDAGKGINVLGRLEALGESNSTISFIPFVDAIYWKGIKINPNGSANFDHIYISYAGELNPYSGGAISATQADLTVRNSTFENTQLAITALDSRSELTKNTIRNTQMMAIALADSGASTPGVTRMVDNNIDGSVIGVNAGVANIVMEGNIIKNSLVFGAVFQTFSAVSPLTSIKGNIFEGNGVPVNTTISFLPHVETNNSFTNNRNQMIVLSGGTLAGNVTLGENGIKSYIQQGNMTIQSGAFLRVEPGVLWKFGDSSELKVSGLIAAMGSTTEPVVFTSIKDDTGNEFVPATIGTDVNPMIAGYVGYMESSLSSATSSGNWKGIIFDSAHYLSELNNTHIRSANVSILNGSDISIKNSKISDAPIFSINVKDSSPYLIKNTINDTQSGSEELAWGDPNGGVYISGGNTYLEGNTISGNSGDGITLEAGDTFATIKNNLIEYSSGYGINGGYTSVDAILEGNAVIHNAKGVNLPIQAIPNPEAGNILFPNTDNSIYIAGGSRQKDIRLPLLVDEDAGLVVYVVHQQGFNISGNATLNIDPGVVLKFANQNSGIILYEGGSMKAIGTKDLPIIFTSISDDQHGGDTNGDGYSSYPESGDWGAIQAYKDPLNETQIKLVLNHASVLYGGREGTIYLWPNNKAKIENSHIAYSENNGVYAEENNALEVNQSSFYGNQKSGIKVGNTSTFEIANSDFYSNQEHGINVWGESANGVVEDSNLFANTLSALTSRSSLEIDARGNWWGAVDGPSGDKQGSGDKVLEAGAGSVVTSSLLKDIKTNGPEYLYFDVQDNSYRSYRVDEPLDESTLSEHLFSFSGLNENLAYELLITFDSSSISDKQSLVVNENIIIQPPLSIPSLMTYQYIVPENAVVNGNLTVKSQPTEGALKKIKSVTLLAKPKNIEAVVALSISAPNNGQKLSGGVFPISGVYEATGTEVNKVEVKVLDSTGKTQWYLASVNIQSKTWSLPLTLSDSGLYTVSARGLFNNGSLAISSNVVNIDVDLAPPQAVTQLLGTSTNQNVKLFWNLSADDAGRERDVISYTVFRSLDRYGQYTAASTLPQGSDRYTDESVESNKSYYYYVTVSDDNGNNSASNVIGPIAISSASDETAPEDATNFIANSGSVNGGDITVSLRWNQSLNTDNDLVEYRLYATASNWAVFGSNEPNFNNQLHRFLNASDSSTFITGLQAGAAYSYRLTAVDASGNESDGVYISITPTGEESEVIELVDDITEDTYLPASTYKISRTLLVASDAVLNIAEGTIVKFSGLVGLDIQGGLITEGTDNTPVVFTSWKDDAYGGDSNGDGVSSGQPGDWGRIALLSQANGKLDYSILRFGGNSGVASQILYVGDADAQLEGTVVEHSATSGITTEIAGLFGRFSIANSKVSDNNIDGIVLNTPVDVESGITDSTLHNITNNEISRNTVGVNSSRGLVLDGNQLLNNRSYAAKIITEAQPSSLVNNNIAGNADTLYVSINAIPDNSNQFNENAVRHLTLRSFGYGVLPFNTTFYAFGDEGDRTDIYLVEGMLTVSEGYQLTIDPGVVIKFSGKPIKSVDENKKGCISSYVICTGLFVDGSITAESDQEHPIVFTTIFDDLLADSNEDSNQTSPERGDWVGVRINEDAQNVTLRNVSIRYAGRYNYWHMNKPAGLHLASNVSLEGIEVSNSSTSGIVIASGAPEVQMSNMRVWGNNKSGIEFKEITDLNARVSFSRIFSNGDNGVLIGAGNSSSATLTITNSDIDANAGFAIVNNSNAKLYATSNWWGDVSGPQHGTLNPSGLGEQAVTPSDAVLIPYLDKPIVDYSYVNFSEQGELSTGSLSPISATSGLMSDAWDTQNHHPSYTIAFEDDGALALQIDSINADKNYLLHLTLLNGDLIDSEVSVTAGADVLLAEKLVVSSAPTQFQFELPKATYADGLLSVTIQQLADGNTKASVAEVVLVEKVSSLLPTLMERVSFSDVDGDGSYSVDDKLSFTFSGSVDRSLILDGSSDANVHLATSNNAIYGTNNLIHWDDDSTQVTITLTEGFSVEGGETINAFELKDLAGNTVAGSQVLPVEDKIAPNLLSIDWLDFDNSGELSVGDHFVFNFDKVMNPSSIVTGTKQASINLQPAGGLHYGQENEVIWVNADRSVEVTLAEGYSIQGNELVTPSEAIKDVAGNVAVGSVKLSGWNDSAAEIVSVAFDDANGDGSTSLGDSYTIRFSKSVYPFAITDASSDANRVLSPEEKLYGTINKVRWSNGFTELTIELTEGFTVAGNEVVTSNGYLEDQSGHPVTGSVQLTLVDTVPPEIVQVSSTVANPVPGDVDFKLTLQFSSQVKNLSNLKLQGVESKDIHQLTAGQWVSTVYPNDTFITDAIKLNELSDSGYEVLINGSSDLAGNSQIIEQSVYIIEKQRPAPAITSHLPLPHINSALANRVTITGQRVSKSVVWINGEKVTSLRTGYWSANISLVQGENILEIYTKDGEGESSERTTFNFYLDSVAPTIDSILPINNSFVQQPPTNVSVDYSDIGSGINTSSSTLTVSKNGVTVNGSLLWDSGTVSFIPNTPFVDGLYEILVLLTDNSGRQSGVAISQFSVDNTAPSAPEVDLHESRTTHVSIELSGQKQPYEAIYLNGAQYTDHTPGATWAVNAPLNVGENTLSFTAIDRAGNQSVANTTAITRDNQAPELISLVTNGELDGTSVELSWLSYDELANGDDIKRYYIYVAEQPFTSRQDANLVSTVLAGHREYLVTGLQRGKIYYFAVVARDSVGNWGAEALSTGVTTEDKQGPSTVSGLQSKVFASSAIVEWSAPGDADVKGYKVYVNNSLKQELEGRNATSATINSLQPVSANRIAVSAIDYSGNESIKVEVQAVTLLDNPVITDTRGEHGVIHIEWAHSSLPQYVSEYRVHLRDEEFNKVIYSPELRVKPSLNKASIAGLANGTTYYVAVTARNLNQLEDQNVISVAVTPQADEDGPALSPLSHNSALLVENVNVTRSGEITLTAKDPSGINRVEFYLNSQMMGADTNGSNSYRQYWDLSEVPDGSYVLAVKAYDVHENVTEQFVTVNVILGAPSSPVILSPETGDSTNQNSIVVKGEAEPNTRLKLFNNGSLLSDNTQATPTGEFTASAVLQEGDNNITVQIAYPMKDIWSDSSNLVAIVMDTSIPNGPNSLNATSEAKGTIRLSWGSAGEVVTKGYYVYRAAQPFSAVSEGLKLNTELLQSSEYIDSPDFDGTYYYRVVAVNDAGTESYPSPMATVVSDRVPPAVQKVTYSPVGQHDYSTGRTAAGTVKVEVEFDEPLRNNPFFTLTASGGTPINIDIEGVPGQSTTYSGSFTVETETPSGTYYAYIVAHDKSGNRSASSGSDGIPVGAFILLDTDGPVLESLQLSVESPIDNTPDGQGQDLSLDIAINLSDYVKPGSVPKLIPYINGQSISGYENGIQLGLKSNSETDAKSWIGRIEIPSDVGLDSDGQGTVDTLSFGYEAYDDLSNQSTKIIAKNDFQIYQGELPPLGIPSNLIAKPKAGGVIELNWDVVEGAVGYELYRKGPNDTEFLAVVDINLLLNRNELTTAIDGQSSALQDGSYQYSIASLRRVDSQTSRSALSEPVTVSADSTATAQPVNLKLELAGSGIYAQWEAPANSDAETLTYNVYRSEVGDGEPVDITGLIPVKTELPLEPDASNKPQGFMFSGFTSVPEGYQRIDQPSPIYHTYVVTAVDESGNESAPSDSVYLNFGLVPVSEFKVSLPEGELPKLSWKHDGDAISGFNVYRRIGKDGEAVQINSSTITGTEYIDQIYNGGVGSDGGTMDVYYEVSAVDSNSIESIKHAVRLPALSARLGEYIAGELISKPILKRGVMNQLYYTIKNTGQEDIRNVMLKVMVKDGEILREHRSESFDVAAHGEITEGIIVGGYTGLDGYVEVSSSLVVSPAPGDEVSINQSEHMSVEHSELITTIIPESFTRGGLGSLRLRFENTSEVATDLVLAKQRGSVFEPSTEVRVLLQDQDGSVLLVQPVKQFTGGTITVSDGRIIARVDAGEVFESEPIAIAIPESAPDNLVVKLEIDKVHYQTARDTEVVLDGMTTTYAVTLTDTPYYAQVTSISPESVFGEETVIIKGRAVSRVDGAVVANVPLQLIVSVHGFERKFSIFTDASGEFSYEYTTAEYESGRYTVSVVHPELRTRPNHGSFVVQGILGISPSEVNFSLAKNYQDSFDVQVFAGFDTELTNVRFVLAPESEGAPLELPEGMSVNLSSPIDIKAKEAGFITFNMAGTKLGNGSLRYKLVSDNTEKVLSYIYIDYSVMEAEPRVSADPTFVDTGVAREQSRVESVRLLNTGLADLINAKVSLSLSNTDQIDVPNWITLQSSSELGDVPVGGESLVKLSVAPSESVAINDYQFWLRVSADNLDAGQELLIPVYVAVPSSSQGDVHFHVADIYTGTMGDLGQPIPGLMNADIELQNEQLLSAVYTLKTDGNGEASVTDIPSGRYFYRVSAKDHFEDAGWLWVKAGTTASQNVLLANELVTVEWAVKETSIKDKYETVLTPKYETDVPAAVVIQEPANITLPNMQKGDVYSGEIRFVNKGLVTAHNMTPLLEMNTDNIRFEILKPLPDTLAPGESVVIPYRIVMLESMTPELEGDSSGAGPTVLHGRFSADYSYFCPSGNLWVNTSGTRMGGNVTCTSCGYSFDKDTSTLSLRGNVHINSIRTTLGGGGSGGGSWGGGGGSRSGTGQPMRH